MKSFLSYFYLKLASLSSLVIAGGHKRKLEEASEEENGGSKVARLEEPTDGGHGHKEPEDDDQQDTRYPDIYTVDLPEFTYSYNFLLLLSNSLQNKFFYKYLVPLARSMDPDTFFCGLECIGHSFAYVAHFDFLRVVCIQTQRAA